MPPHEVRQRFEGKEICAILSYLEEEPEDRLILDRHFSILHATLRQIFGDRSNPDDFFLIRKPAPISEEDETQKLLGWMQSIKR